MKIIKQILIFLSMLLFLTCCYYKSFSQLQVQKVDKTIGKIKNLSNFNSDLSYEISNNDTIYTIKYRNLAITESVDIELIIFKGNQSTLDQLQSLLNTVFLPEFKKNKSYNILIKLGSEDVTISVYRKLLDTSVIIYVKYKGYFILSKDEVKKLFGK